MTLRGLEKEVLGLPPRTRLRLVDKIIASMDEFVDPKVAAAWEKEIQHRVREIQSGTEPGIPAGQVMQTARQALNEARRLPSARRQ